MHITHVITKFDYGGAQTVVRELAAEQLRRGHAVTIVTGTLGAESHAAEALGATITPLHALGRSVHPWRDRAALQQLIEALRSDRPEIVHTHSSKGGLLGRLAARRLGLPVLYTAHGWPFQSGASRSQQVQSYVGERLGARVGGPVVCVTRADIALARRVRLCDPDRLHLIHNGVGRLTSLAGVRHRNANDPLRLVMVARFAPPKRQDLLIDAVASMGDKVTVTFVGDGDLLEVARAQADPVGDRVRFVGQCDPAAHLEAADALVLLSDYEGLPMSVIEAMRVGLPVIANRLPGIVDALDDGETGLVTGLDRASIVAAIGRLAGDSGFTARLGVQARQRWARSFTAEHMADAYEKLYVDACSDGAERR
jgi:glycosyltransferase involved in cell wall biosynthesis